MKVATFRIMVVAAAGAAGVVDGTGAEGGAAGLDGEGPDVQDMAEVMIRDSISSEDSKTSSFFILILLYQ